jgi:hypothetical protein
MLSYLRLHLELAPTGRRRPVVVSGNGERGRMIKDRPLGGPMARRVLGRALIKRFCLFDSPRCQAQGHSDTDGDARGSAAEELCSLAGSCPYGVLYAASRSARPPFALWVPPATDGKIELVEVTLLGAGWRSYAWVVLALRDALETGLGRERQSFEIVEVLQITPDRKRLRLCGSDLTQLPADLEPFTCGLSVEPFGSETPIVIELLSPLRLIQDGRLLRGRPGGDPAGIAFDLLIARILDRFQGVYCPPFLDHGAEEPCVHSSTPEILMPDTRRTVEREASRVPLLSDHTRWVEVPDYSARHHRSMRLGGWVGELVYGGAAAHFLAILKAGEILHLGKNPSSGCGRIRVSLPSPAA